jgi:hypothetical protein
MSFSKFDIEPGCEERCPDFVPTHNERVDALSEEQLAELYKPNFAAELFAFADSVNRSLYPIPSDEIVF